MRDVKSHILGLLDQAPKTQERVAQALHVEAHPTGAGQAVLTLQQGGMYFQWHPVSQKVYYLKPRFKDGRQVSFLGQVIAFNIVTHGDAINATLIWKRGYDEARDPGGRPDLTEGG